MQTIAQCLKVLRQKTERTEENETENGSSISEENASSCVTHELLRNHSLLIFCAKDIDVKDRTLLLLTTRL